MDPAKLIQELEAVATESPELKISLPLDPDLLALFEGGMRTEALLGQIVRLLTQIVADKAGQNVTVTKT